MSWLINKIIDLYVWIISHWEPDLHPINPPENPDDHNNTNA